MLKPLLIFFFCCGMVLLDWGCHLGTGCDYNNELKIDGIVGYDVLTGYYDSSQKRCTDIEFLSTDSVSVDEVLFGVRFSVERLALLSNSFTMLYATPPCPPDYLDDVFDSVEVYNFDSIYDGGSLAFRSSGRNYEFLDSLKSNSIYDFQFHTSELYREFGHLVFKFPDLLPNEIYAFRIVFYTRYYGPLEAFYKPIVITK